MGLEPPSQGLRVQHTQQGWRGQGGGDREEQRRPGNLESCLFCLDFLPRSPPPDSCVLGGAVVDTVRVRAGPPFTGTSRRINSETRCT